MKTIGLLGGMSWESSAVYYRDINRAMRRRCGGLTSAKIVLHSLDFAQIVALQKAGQWDEAGNVLGRAARGLEMAGAECVLICTNTMHLVAPEVARHCSIPLIDIIDTTAQAILAQGGRRPLLLATRYTMEHGFYARQMAKHGLDILVPNERDRTEVHSAIFDELCQGVVLPATRRRLKAIVERGIASGADSLILGCTEICLILSQRDSALPIFDSTGLHVTAAVDFALGAQADGLPAVA